MVNRNTNHPFGLFNFPFFAPAQPSFHLNVEDKENELVIEGQFEGFEKENIIVEVVRNGVFIAAEQQEEKNDEKEEEQQQSAPLQNVQRFVPVNFSFTEKDVSASFNAEGKVLTITIDKNDANRKFISIE